LYDCTTAHWKDGPFAHPSMKRFRLFSNLGENLVKLVKRRISNATSKLI